MSLFRYCKKCGTIKNSPNPDVRCCCCNSKMYLVPEEYKVNGWLPEEQQELVREELVKTSPQFDQYAYDQRDEILKKQRDEYERQDALLSRYADKPECPTCHSKNIRRISGVERGASIIGLGIFSNKINKSFKCNSCGYTW